MKKLPLVILTDKETELGIRRESLMEIMEHYQKEKPIPFVHIGLGDNIGEEIARAHFIHETPMIPFYPGLKDKSDDELKLTINRIYDDVFCQPIKANLTLPKEKQSNKTKKRKKRK